MTDDRFADAVRAAITQAMTAAGVSQDELAKRLGVSAARISQVLAGGNLTLKSVDRILRALEVCPDFTIGAVVTPEEARIVDQLGGIWNAYLALPIEHPQDRVEFLTMIHGAQEKVLSRAGRRRIRLGA